LSIDNNPGMNASAILWTYISRLHAAGRPQLAARLANLLASGRKFTIDADGDWHNEGASATLVSPDPHGLRYGYLQEVVADEWLHHYRPSASDIVFDIGAGIGEEAVVLASLVRHVYSIEANPVTFRCLTKTVRLSGLGNVTPIHCAVADADGELTIETGSNHLANSVMRGGGQVVPARSIQSLCAELGVPSIDFLRMNIEGAESLAMHGFGDVPIRHLAISCHDFIDGPQFQTRTAVVAHLEANGYDVTGRPDHPRPWTRQMVYATGR
jgi:FkbM family methyltransferase